MSTLDLEALVGRIERPDEDVRRHARDEVRRLVQPPDGLGRLGDLAVWLAGAQGVVPPRPLAGVRLLVLAADHGIVAAAVSAYHFDATAGMAARILAGSAPVSVAADVVGVPLRVHDIALDRDTDASSTTDTRVRRSSGRIDVEDAMTDEEAADAIATGLSLVDHEVDAGADLLVLAEVGVGATTPAAALVGLLTGSDASAVVGRGSGIDDATWMRKCAAIRDAMRRGRPRLADQVGLLATAGSPDLAVATGVLLGAAARRTPVLLDGVGSAAAALVAQRVAFRAVDWWVAAHDAHDPAQAVALDRLSLVPLLDLGLTVGEGLGAVSAVPLLRTASRLLADVTPWLEDD